jgi:hypothetical protein
MSVTLTRIEVSEGEAIEFGEKKITAFLSVDGRSEILSLTAEQTKLGTQMVWIVGAVEHSNKQSEALMRKRIVVNSDICS